MVYFFLILFIVLSIFVGFMLRLALNRITKLEEVLLRIDSIINTSSEKLRVIDSRGIFESDDEIGFMFDEIKFIQEELDMLFESQETEENVSERDSEKEDQEATQEKE